MNTLTAIQQNKSLRDTILKNFQEIQNIHTAFWKDLNEKYHPNAPVIATGHQPIFYYPGILFKDYLAGKLASETDGTALNFIVDSDEGAIEIPVPCLKEQELSKTQVALKTKSDTAFSEFKPSLEDIKRFFIDIERNLYTLNGNGEHIRQSFQEYQRAFAEKFEEKGDFIQTTSELRSAFDKDLGLDIINLRISDLSNTHPYNLFILYIIKYIQEYQFHFNKVIDERTNKNFQPVKKLSNTNEGFELPFWLLKNTRRHTVFAKQQANQIILISPETEDEISINANAPLEIQAEELNRKVTLYPKAPTLTFMIRIFFSDLFIHGTGAVDYEKINNQFLQSFFQINAPLKFISATGDTYLPLKSDLPDLQELKTNYEQLKKWKKEYKRNPEDLLSAETAEKYKKQKKDLARQMKEAEPQKRKEIHNQMEQLNEEMRIHLAEDFEENETLLTHYGKILEKEHIYLERKYPYFLYPKGTLTKKQFETNLQAEMY
jgi:uncharacterized protein YhfF